MSEPNGAGTLTDVLQRYSEETDESLGELYGVALDHLKRMARAALRGTPLSELLSATDMVHEVFTRFLKTGLPAFPNRAAFFVYVSRQIRGIVVDVVRQRSSQKRGGEAHHVALDEALDSPAARSDIELVLAVDRALEHFRAVDPQLTELVELHFFAGFTFEEIAEVFGVSRSTALRWWKTARLWLREELGEDWPGS